MKLHEISIAALAMLAGAPLQSTDQTSAETQSVEATVDDAVADILKFAEEERIRDARTEVCRLAAEKSDDFWEIYEQAVAQDPSIGPATEIAKRCHFFIAGRLYQNQKRLDEMRR